MKSTGTFNLKRVVQAGKYSMQGLKAAIQYEAAFRQELILSLLLTPLALYISHKPLDYLLCFGSLIVLLLVELLNSAIEAVVDRFGGEMHALSGRAKDMGSAAVTLAMVLVVLCWLVVWLG